MIGSTPITLGSAPEKSLTSKGVEFQPIRGLIWVSTYMFFALCQEVWKFILPLGVYALLLAARWASNWMSRGLLGVVYFMSAISPSLGMIDHNRTFKAVFDQFFI